MFTSGILKHFNVQEILSFPCISYIRTISTKFWMLKASFVIQYFDNLFLCLGHPWLANYHDVKIPTDMIVFKLVKAYICSSSLRKSALGVRL